MASAGLVLFTKIFGEIQVRWQRLASGRLALLAIE
jgi:hypothetical protein